MNYEVDLSSAVVSGVVTIRFRGESGNEPIYGVDFFQDLAIDNVAIEETPSCVTMTSVAVASAGVDSLDVVVTDPNNATEYFVTYTDGTTTDTLSNPSASSFGIGGLSANTAYTVTVRAILASDSWHCLVLYNRLWPNHLFPVH